MDYLDPEAPVADPHADRPRWHPVYMGEGIAPRCRHCAQELKYHDGSVCRESFLRIQDGNR